jgi:hypothetical protein
VSDDKSPIEKAVELAVYAPVGFLNFMRSMLPGWIEGGRQEVHKGLSTAKVMTEFAVAQGRQDAEKRVTQAAEVIGGLAARRNSSNGPSPAAAPAPPAAAPSPPPAAPAPTVASTPSAAASNGPRPSDDGLAIPGYDSLAASQVVQRLAGLSGAELEAVRAYEAATRGRRTILNKVDQLQAEK